MLLMVKVKGVDVVPVTTVYALIILVDSYVHAMVGLLTLLHVTVPVTNVPDVAELCHCEGKLNRM